MQAPLSARGRLETRLQLPIGFGANAGSLAGVRGGQSFRIDAPSFALLEPSVSRVAGDGDRTHTLCKLFVPSDAVPVFADRQSASVCSGKLIGIVIGLRTR